MPVASLFKVSSYIKKKVLKTRYVSCSVRATSRWSIKVTLSVDTILSERKVKTVFKIKIITENIIPFLFNREYLSITNQGDLAQKNNR